MANLREQSIWETGVYQIEENDPVHGGPNGITNRPIKQLANRTVWLKNELASSVQAINASLANLSNNKADKALNLVAGDGLTGGGDLSSSRSLSLGTPSKITATTTNTAVSNTHSHEIDKASTTTQGIVQLNDSLTSSATDRALTANQGKVLNDTKANIASPTFTGTPKAPTPSSNSNDTTLATTAFVKSTQPQVSVLTGTIDHGGTLPLPSGFSESQCHFMVSVNKDNPNKSAWDINEQGTHFHYGFECWAEGRKVHVGAYLGHYGSRTNFVAGVANYIVIGVK